MNANWDQSNFEQQVIFTEEWVRQAMISAAKVVGQSVLERSLELVPRATDTLASSGYYEVASTSEDVIIDVGYGGNGDPINPHSHTRASEYEIGRAHV